MTVTPTPEWTQRDSTWAERGRRLLRGRVSGDPVKVEVMGWRSKYFSNHYFRLKVRLVFGSNEKSFGSRQIQMKMLRCDTCIQIYISHECLYIQCYRLSHRRKVAALSPALPLQLLFAKVFATSSISRKTINFNCPHL